ncbi:MAG TPA: hypothetical protein VEY69_05945, partial [Lautropia sp.]|nr:hypothetical protein [Lautropia sp.]
MRISGALALWLGVVLVAVSALGPVAVPPAAAAAARPAAPAAKPERKPTGAHKARRAARDAVPVVARGEARKPARSTAKGTITAKNSRLARAAPSGRSASGGLIGATARSGKETTGARLSSTRSRTASLRRNSGRSSTSSAGSPKAAAAAVSRQAMVASVSAAKRPVGPAPRSLHSNHGAAAALAGAGIASGAVQAGLHPFGHDDVGTPSIGEATG